MRETRQLWRLFQFISILVLTLTLDSCKFISVNWRNRPEPERSILTGIPCSPPCWQGITPGVTTETEALDILHRNPITKNATIDEDLTSHYSSPQLTLKLFYAGWDDVDLYTRNNVVEVVYVKPLSQLRLGELVARYGPPDKFAARGYPADKPDWGFDVSFFYPKVGFVADLHTAPRKNDYGKFIVAEEMQVNDLYYFPAGSMDDVSKIAHDRISALLVPLQLLQDWKGFGPIDMATPSTLATPAEITKTQSTPPIIPPVNETGLVIGQSTEDQVKDLLGEPTHVQGDVLRGTYSWYYRHSNRPDISVVFSRGILQEIEIEMPEETTAESIVQQKGPPEIVILYTSSDHKDEPPPHEPSPPPSGYLAYPSRGIRFFFVCLDNCNKVSRKTPIFRKIYFAPSTIREWLEKQLPTPNFNVLAWKGFDP